MNRTNKKQNTLNDVISFIKTSPLSKEERARLKDELEHREAVKKGTVWFQSWNEYHKFLSENARELMSPGGAADEAGITRARIHQLETERKIRVYRMKADKTTSVEEVLKDRIKNLPFWLKPFIALKPPKGDCYIWVDMNDLREYMKDRKQEDK